MGLTILGIGPIKTLARENRLRVADVLLVHTKRSIVGWIIRYYTKNYWNHAALVYAVPEKGGFANTFIVESAGQGIVLHKIDHYLKHPHKYDVGIKRLAAPWYEDGNASIGWDFARQVRDYSLQALDAKYGWNIIVVLAMIAFGRSLLKIHFLPAFTLIWILFLSRIAYAGVVQILLLAGSNLRKGAAIGLRKLAQLQAGDRPLRLAKLSNWVQPQTPYQPTKTPRPRVAFPSGLEINRYICSGFVQWAYFQVMLFYTDNPLDTTSIKPSQVVFNPYLDINDPQEDILLFTTPGDLARSQNLSWRYIVQDGMVWQLSVRYRRVRRRIGFTSSYSG